MCRKCDFVKELVFQAECWPLPASEPPVLPSFQTVIAVLQGPTAMPAARTRAWDGVSVNPASRAPTVSSVLLDSMGLAATVSATPHLLLRCPLHQALTDQLFLALQHASVPALG